MTDGKEIEEYKRYVERCAMLLKYLEKNYNNLSSNSSYIISLTSYGYRLKSVWLTIQSVFNQSCKFAKVVLWVAYQDKHLINEKLKLLEKSGLTICFCDDIRSYKKLVYTVKEYNDYNIITIDDDVIYSRDYFKKLINLHKKHPRCICCYRAHEIKFNGKFILPYKEWGFHSLGIKGPSMKIMPIGIGGVLYPAGTFLFEDFDFTVINEVAPFSDDIYFKWIEMEKRVCVVKVYKNKKHNPYYIANTQENSLKMMNVVSGNNNDIAIKKIENYFQNSFWGKLSLTVN